MCGILAIAGPGASRSRAEAAVLKQSHRGPDATGLFADPERRVALGHNRLSIIDLSPAGRQPMVDASGRYHIVFNGEIYNYLELRRELQRECQFRTGTDTEVLLAAYLQWGPACLDRLIGMFAFAVWDQREQSLFAARDRFGVKPLYYHVEADGTLLLSSEIKALHAAGVSRRPDAATWAGYLAHGLYERGEHTFWEGVHTVPPGAALRFRDGALEIRRWYDLASHADAEYDSRSVQEVQEEYLDLLKESVQLRFRADVPVGINLSGGLDSSTLLGLVQAVQGEQSEVQAFTFATGDAAYDETPWVQQMLARTRHPSVICTLTAEQVPALAASVQAFQDEPFGGLPTLAYARVFEEARQRGVIVLLDGQGMDEQWAGYDYYLRALNGSASASTVQGTSDSPVRPECLRPELRELAEPLRPETPFPDPLRNLQYRDVRYTKIPRALRFNDRVSMRSSTELREPFLDHRLFELAFRQPAERKIADGTRKWLLRQAVRPILPQGVVEAPKRPLQTPQREWLRGPLCAWAEELIETALTGPPREWLDAQQVRKTWTAYRQGQSDNSFYVWQWLSVALCLHE
ncbi:MAG: asparagine synthase (glutamine-hydrolyzing) [Armatimonadota bacterium]